MSVLGVRRAVRIAALALAVLCVTPALAAATPGRHLLHPHALPAPAFHPASHWAVNRPLCASAEPGYRGCFAVARKPVPAGTPGAYPYTPAALHGPAGGLTPSALAKAYGINANAATSQLVAVVDAYDDPHAFTELSAFDAKYGLPRETASTFKRVAQDATRTDFPTLNKGWAVEEALDVQSVRAMCRKCKIMLVEANSATRWNLSRAVETAYRLGANVISNSYGGTESADEDPRVEQAYTHKGVVVTAATGDYGWYGWDQINDGWPSNNAPDDPAAFPGVVAVGGTKLTLNSDGSVASERVWNRDGQADATGLRSGAQGASGGGCSLIYDAENYQKDVAGYSHLGCGSGRMVGDIAADADPTTGMDVYSDYVGGNHWETIGGTSLSAPLIAGMWAVAGGPGGAEKPAKTLYDNLLLRPSSLFDVRIGSNGFCGASDVVIAKYDCSRAVQKVAGTGDPNLMSFNDGSDVGNVDCGWRQDGVRATVSDDWQCRAHAGYDGPSGVGTPRSNQVFRTTATARLTVPGTATVGSPVTASGSGNVTVRGDSLESCAFYWGDGSPGTQVPCSAGQSVSAQHTYRSAGVWAAKLVVVDTQGERVTATRPVKAS